MAQSQERTVGDMVFVGLNRRVIALDRFDGHIVWEWKAPRGSGFVSILLDGDRLVASVSGYVYCLDPVYGQVVWENALRGYGTGYATLASVHGVTRGGAAAAATVAAQQAATAATTSAAAVG